MQIIKGACSSRKTGWVHMSKLSYHRRAFQVPVGSSLGAPIALLLSCTLDSRAPCVGFSSTPRSFPAAIQRQVRTLAQQRQGAGG